MIQNRHTTGEGKYKHITEKERHRIEAYLRDKKKPKEIIVKVWDESQKSVKKALDGIERERIS